MRREKDQSWRKIARGFDRRGERFGLAHDLQSASNERVHQDAPSQQRGRSLPDGQSERQRGWLHQADLEALGAGPLPRAGAGGRVRGVERRRRLQPTRGAAVPRQGHESGWPGDRSLIKAGPSPGEPATADADCRVAHPHWSRPAIGMRSTRSGGRTLKRGSQAGPFLGLLALQGCVLLATGSPHPPPTTKVAMAR